MASLEFLPQTIHFSTGESFVRLESITDFRQCHGTIPYESRILYRCRRLAPQTPTPATSATDIKDEEQGSYILKVKIQIPDPTTASNSNSNSNSTHASPPPPGPSSTTTHETHALQLFREAQSPAGPNLIASENFPQPPNGLLPGGYISCTIMTRIPGRSLYELGYWSLAAEQREEIQQRFVETLKSVRKLGIEPGDKGLRNVMWDAESGNCGLVDFELWHEYSADDVDEAETTDELLQKWGLAHRPPAKNWWAEFGIKTY